jgi:hypothetical protein
MRTFRIGETTAEAYGQGLVVLQGSLARASWLRGQGALTKKRGNSMLRGGADEDEEEDTRRNPISRLIKRSDAVSDFAKAASSLGKNAGLTGAGGDEGA